MGSMRRTTSIRKKLAVEGGAVGGAILPLPTLLNSAAKTTTLAAGGGGTAAGGGGRGGRSGQPGSTAGASRAMLMVGGTSMRQRAVVD